MERHAASTVLAEHHGTLLCFAKRALPLIALRIDSVVVRFVVFIHVCTRHEGDARYVRPLCLVSIIPFHGAQRVDRAELTPTSTPNRNHYFGVLVCFALQRSHSKEASRPSYSTHALCTYFNQDSNANVPSYRTFCTLWERPLQRTRTTDHCKSRTVPHPFPCPPSVCTLNPLAKQYSLSSSSLNTFFFLCAEELALFVERAIL